MSDVCAWCAESAWEGFRVFCALTFQLLPGDTPACEEFRPEDEKTRTEEDDPHA